MGWLSCTKKSPVIQPLQKNTNTTNYSETATGTLNPKNNYGEISHTLRKIQKNASPEISIRSDKVTYSSDQYALIEAAGTSIMSVGSCIHDISGEARKIAARRRPEEKIKIFFDMAKKRIEDFPDKFGAVDIKDPLLEKNLTMIKLSNQLLSSYDNIKQVTLNNSDIGFFFDEDNFMYTTGHNFNKFCLNIADDNFFKKLGTDDSFDKWDYLAHVGAFYAEKEIIKNQLPQVENKFKELKKSGKTPKDLLSIIEKTIAHTKIGIHNMEHSERMAIFERIAPVARPKSFDDVLQVFTKNKTLLTMPEKEIDAIYDKLRKIPFCLVP